MPKHLGENYLSYQSRVLDRISPSFCAAKWLTSTIWLNRGWTTSCHLPPHHKINRWALRRNPSALHNTRAKKAMRQQMLNGQRPPECDACWKIEDMNRQAVSDRIFKTEIYSDAQIQKIATLPARADVMPKRLEIAFDRICNLACSYCNSTFSTTWAKDIKTFGPYHLKSDGGHTYKVDGSRGEFASDKNPYLQAFWKWWPELKQHLEELRIGGGEPLMSKQFWQLIKSLQQNPVHSLRLAINSNLVARDSLIDALIAASHDIAQIEIYTSNEAFGAHAEYIRDGLHYDTWRANLLKLKARGRFNRIHIMMTVNALCLFSLTDLFDDILAMRRTTGCPDFGHWTLNLLRFPSFMSPSVLPLEIRQSRSHHLQQWLERNHTNSLLQEMEQASIYRLIHYLNEIETPHANSSSLSCRQSDFVAFWRQYDQRRGKDFRQTFPAELVDWMRQSGTENVSGVPARSQTFLSHR